MAKKLTGAFRYRTGFFGKQILQVEESEEVQENVFNTGYFDDYIRYTWRDAKKNDYQALTILGKMPNGGIIPEEKTEIIPLKLSC